MPGTVPRDLAKALASNVLGAGAPPPSGRSADERRAYDRLSFAYTKGRGATVPVTVSVFPNELYQAPRSWAEQAFPNLMYFNEVDQGNHFAAGQQSELFTTEVRAAFRSLRTKGGPL
jgi:hypothetical protein